MVHPSVKIALFTLASASTLVAEETPDTGYVERSYSPVSGRQN